MTSPETQAALQLLDLHFETFHSAQTYADATGHPVPTDTRGWSQILVSTLTEMRGRDRKKGSDLKDGSDVKGANTWGAIDTPRFNGVIKAGTQAQTSGSIQSLDTMPFLYFVLWDETARDTARCRVWVVRTRTDPVFRAMCKSWYEQRAAGSIKSDNFQLHPPRGQDSNEMRNSCGNLLYPLYFSAERAKSQGQQYKLVHYDAQVLTQGLCQVS